MFMVCTVVKYYVCYMLQLLTDILTDADNECSFLGIVGGDAFKTAFFVWQVFFLTLK